MLLTVPKITLILSRTITGLTALGGVACATEMYGFDRICLLLNAQVMTSSSKRLKINPQFSPDQVLLLSFSSSRSISALVFLMAIAHLPRYISPSKLLLIPLAFSAPKHRHLSHHSHYGPSNVLLRVRRRRAHRVHVP